MALTQMQLIQSLGEAMSWLERELSWGVPATELRHLCGRIGELYAAVICNGQMAQRVNQKGYDVVGSQGERISVKTTATAGSAGIARFNLNSLDQVDRVMILRVNTEEMQIDTLFDGPVHEARSLMGETGVVSVASLLFRMKPQRAAKKVAEARYRDLAIRELESGTIEVEREGQILSPTMPHLVAVAAELGVSTINDGGTKLNTRQLGTRVIKTLSKDEAISDGPAAFQPDI